MSATGTSSALSEPFRLQTSGRVLAAVLVVLMAAVVAVSLYGSVVRAWAVWQQLVVGVMAVVWLFLAYISLTARTRVDLQIDTAIELDGEHALIRTVDYRGAVAFVEFERNGVRQPRILLLTGNTQREFKLAVIRWQATHERQTVAT